MSNKGLGRGLGALFSAFDEEPVKEVKKPAEKEHEEIPIGLIDRNTSQPRKDFNEESLNELAQSIRAHGVIQPIILVKKNDRYMIVSGERRWRASKIAGLKEIPAVIREYTDAQIAQIALIENLQREDLNPIESAKAIKELIDKYNLTQEEVSEKIGKSRSAVTNTLRLLALQPEVIKMIESGKLSAGHGKILVSIDDKESQIRIANMAVDGKISVRELEKYLQVIANRQPKEHKTQKQSLELLDFSRDLQNRFSTKVTIKGSEQKGKITIEYYSKDDLDRIYSLLKY